MILKSWFYVYYLIFNNLLRLGVPQESMHYPQPTPQVVMVPASGHMPMGYTPSVAPIQYYPTEQPQFVASSPVVYTPHKSGQTTFTQPLHHVRESAHLILKIHLNA